jgi:hypothetical protein
MNASPGRIVGPNAAKMLFTVCGIWLMGLGLYFMFMRPALLPEDLRYIGATLSEIRSDAPGIIDWLGRVFTVMGGFMMAAGALTILAGFNLARLSRGLALTVLAASGVLTVGTMSVTNFQLASDFKWLLLIPPVLWTIGFVSYQRQG